MTNLEHFRRLPLEDVAALLITTRTFEDYDYNYDEELEYRGLESVFVCSDGEEFEDYEPSLTKEQRAERDKALAYFEEAFRQIQTE